ncbi:MAG: sulfite exporter TauE/SafE family protein [bacterium]|nr:sulfite exporter TauE/SafE family protein [bacterium]
MASKHNRVVYISGMHCASCEVLISDSLKKINGIEDIKISHRKGSAQVACNCEEFPWQDIEARIKSVGYEASLTPIKNQRSKVRAEQWFYSILLVLGIYLIYKYLKWIGLLGWFSVDVSNVNYGAAFIIGIVASLSTCLMVVGAVVMSFASKYNASGNFYQKNLKPHLLFHLGRLTTFFLLGGVLGIIGSWFKVSDAFISAFTIFIALVLLWLALNILGFVSSISALGIRMPKKSLSVWNKLQESEHAMAPLALGALSFFLPCGFTQSMQLFAMSSGSFLTGAMTLFIFALGTMPVLFGLGVATTRFKNMKTVVVQKAIGLMVLFFAFYTLSSGLAIRGIDINFLAENKMGNVISSANAQVVNMAVDYSGYNPSVFKLQRGVPVKWVIDGQQVSGCTRDIIVPSLNIRRTLSPGENIIEFTPEKAGTINFSCSMGMVRGKFIVE